GNLPRQPQRPAHFLVPGLWSPRPGSDRELKAKAFNLPTPTQNNTQLHSKQHPTSQRPTPKTSKRRKRSNPTAPKNPHGASSLEALSTFVRRQHPRHRRHVDDRGIALAAVDGPAVVGPDLFER